MEQKEELIDKVERYLSGELSRKEVREELDQDLSDEDLDETIDLFKASKDLIELSGLKEDLASIHEEYIAEGQVPPKRNNRWIWTTLAMAAAVLLLAVFSGVFETKPPQFEDYFKPYDDVVTIRGGEGSNAKDTLARYFETGMNLYSMGDFEKAIAAFDKLPADYGDASLKFYKGIAHMGVSQFDRAIESFEGLRVEENPYWLQTHWYLSLAYWQNGELEKAKNYWQSLDKRSKRYDEAQELLNALP